MPKSSNPTIEMLRKVPGLRGCDDRALRRLAPLVDAMVIPAGAKLMTEGAVGQETFIISEGTVEVTVGGDTVATLGPGEIVGEMAMLDHQPRTATVTARTDVTALVIGPAAFTTFISEPGISRMLATELTNRLRALEARTTAARATAAAES